MPVTAHDHDETYLTTHTQDGLEITQDDIPSIILDAALSLPPDQQPDITHLSHYHDISQCPQKVRLEILQQARKHWHPRDHIGNSNWDPDRTEQAHQLLNNHLGLLVRSPGPKYQTFRNGRHAAGVELWGNVAIESQDVFPNGEDEPHDDDPVFVTRQRVDGAWPIIDVIPASAPQRPN